MILFAVLQRLFALISIAILGLSLWLIWQWWELERSAEAAGMADPSDRALWWGLGLLAFSLLGRFPMLLLLGKSGRDPNQRRAPGAEVTGPDGAVLHVEHQGAAEGPVLVFTHGWGLSAVIWKEARRDLADRFGLVFWDLPGSGRTGRPARGWSLDSFADDLQTVIDTVPAHRPVVLVGHSIGGMTTLTHALRHRADLHPRVAGLALVHTTHTNPLRTMLFSSVFTALQPVIEAAMKLDILISPLLWLMNWQSYLSGSTHLAARIVGFGARPTREQLDRTAILPTKTSPAVQAHGNLAMIRWSVTDGLPAIDTPALVIVGGRDVITKDHAGEHIARALPRAELLRLERAGHMGLLDEAEKVNAAIAAFAGRTAGPVAAPAAAQS